MNLSRPTTKPKLLWAIGVVVLIAVAFEVPIVAIALLTRDLYLTRFGFGFGVVLWAIGFTLSVVYAIRFCSGKYKNLKLLPFKEQRW